MMALTVRSKGSRRGKEADFHEFPNQEAVRPFSTSATIARQFLHGLARLVVAGVLLIGSIESFASPENGVPTNRECVVLLHGLYGMPLTMKRLEWAFEKSGYDVVNVGYPTWRAPLERALESHIHRAIQKRIPSGTTRVHFVTHSMGGISLRLYLDCHRVPNLGRLVMVAPPNQGSKLADPFRYCALARWLVGPNLARLGTRCGDLPQIAGSVDAELGIIAGNGSLLSKWFDPTHPGDGRVTVEATKLPGMTDHIVFPVRHSLMVLRRKTCEQAVAFISNGKFSR